MCAVGNWFLTVEKRIAERDTKTRNREEVSALEFFISFLVAVLGGVACHYIIKWLDGDDEGNS